MTANEIWESIKDAKTAELFFLQNRIKQEIIRRFECAKKGDTHGASKTDQAMQDGKLER